MSDLISDVMSLTSLYNRLKKKNYAKMYNRLKKKITLRCNLYINPKVTIKI